MNSTGTVTDSCADEAPRLPGSLTSWVLTDGKAGDEVQALGVADALGLSPAIRRVRPRPPYSWLMPWGPIDPREGPSLPGSPLAPPFPDIVLASGRKAVPYLRFIKRASGGRTFTVYLKDPRTGAGAADFIWAPVYDRIRGPNVLNTLTAPHRVSSARLAEARAMPDERVSNLPHPRVAVLVGGDSRHHRFTPADTARLIRDLEILRQAGAGLMMTASRRTPGPLRDSLVALARNKDCFLWEGDGANPYIAFLALADFIVATADSTNMIGEAAATGKPVLVFEPAGGHPKFETYLRALKAGGIAHAFRGRLEGDAYQPLNSTFDIARAIAKGVACHREALGHAAPDGPEKP